jgi:hypothetical protein
MTTIINGSSPSITFSDGTTQTSGITTTAGVVGVAAGGTGASTLAANNVLLGNGTSALQAVAPGSNGNILTSNGTTWTSTAPAAGGVTSVATGNGLSGGTITSSGTLVVACPTVGSVGSYAFLGAPQNSQNNFNPGSAYSSLSYTGIIFNGCGLITTNGDAVSGSWRAMGQSNASPSFSVLHCTVFCRIS